MYWNRKSSNQYATFKSKYGTRHHVSVKVSDAFTFIYVKTLKTKMSLTNGELKREPHPFNNEYLKIFSYIIGNSWTCTLSIHYRCLHLKCGTLRKRYAGSLYDLHEHLVNKNYLLIQDNTIGVDELPFDSWPRLSLNHVLLKLSSFEYFKKVPVITVWQNTFLVLSWTNFHFLATYWHF